MTEEQLATVPEPQEPAADYGSDDLAIVKIYHAELDAYGEAPRAGVRLLAGWEIVDPTAAEARQVTDYDPGNYSVAEVNRKLAEVSDPEREAILALERSGKDRSTIDGNGSSDS